MKLRKHLFPLLVLCVTLSLLMVTAFAADGEAITTWTELQSALNAGGTVTLTDDITAAPGDSALSVPVRKTVTLDLNGFTVSRGLDSKTTDGYVIKNEGTLTVKDSKGGGRITGGYNSSDYEDFTTIEIYGGTVTATGKSKGAGIGSGTDGKGSAVTITGVIINAKSEDSSGFGIGDGKNKKGSSAITLGYTDASADNIEIFASSFSGTVTLQKPFGKITGSGGVFTATFYPGTADSGLLGGGYLKAWDGELLSWADLQRAINDAGARPDRSTLTSDITAVYGVDGPLTIGANQTILIDLNGHTLDRALTDREAAEDGCVIDNASTLTLIGGTVTGGSSAGDAGGIQNAGTLTLTDVTIVGNKAVGSGGGIRNSGTLNLAGGEITGNSAGQQGGGILQNGTLNIFGAPVVSGNTAGQGSNIYLRGAHPTMTVAGELTDGADIWVTSASGIRVITSGYGASNGTAEPGAFFHADDEQYAVRDYFAGFDRYVEQGIITDPVTIELVHALADYGHYVQLFLSETRDWSLGSDYQTISSKENKPMAKKELTAAARQDEKKMNAAIPEVIRGIVPEMLRVLTKL